MWFHSQTIKYYSQSNRRVLIVNKINHSKDQLTNLKFEKDLLYYLYLSKERF